MRGRLFINLLTVTLLALVAIYHAIFSINVSGIASTNWTDAELVRQRCPFRLIQPEWVSSDDTLWNWLLAETRARLCLVAGLWLGCMGVIVWRHLRKRNANHSV